MKTRMKVIWAKENVQTNVEKSIRNLSSKDSTLTLTKRSSCIVNHESRGRQASQANTYSECVICARDSELTALGDHSGGLSYRQLLLECFAVKVRDPALKICSQCALLVRSSHKFKELVTSALVKPVATSQTSSVSGCASEMNVLQCAQSERDRRYMRGASVKRRANQPERDANSKKSKATVYCNVCRQKYSMMGADSDSFVCCRCKIKGGRGVAWRGAWTVGVPALTDLKGRCRLRSLTKKPSKTLTPDISKKSCKKLVNRAEYCHTKAHRAAGELMSCVCSLCGKDMRAKQFLDRHMKVHEMNTIFECNVCGKIFKTTTAYQKHYAIHDHRKQF